jgi:hypothetical protein
MRVILHIKSLDVKVHGPYSLHVKIFEVERGEDMTTLRPLDPQFEKLLIEAHLEVLRGGRRRPPERRVPRRN